MKITSAMKMVSAAKLKKAQDAIVQMRPYASKLTEILQKASSTLGVTFSTQQLKTDLCLYLSTIHHHLKVY